MILINIYDFKSNVGVSEYLLFLCGVVIAFVLGVSMLGGVFFGMLDISLVKLQVIISSLVSDVQV